MPELPEVETILQGLKPHLEDKQIVGLEVRNGALRWPIPRHLDQSLNGQRINGLSRRAKYLLFQLAHGHLIVHLGMSGSLRLVSHPEAPNKHDHYDLMLDDGNRLRFHDPRRFGALLWVQEEVMHHPLLKHLGIEPLAPEFNGNELYRLCRNRRVSIKNLLMNSRIVAGIGNIYANEALFRAGIHPKTAARRLSCPRCGFLVQAIKKVLQEAIRAGGSTLRDFVNATGEPGYFQIRYRVYGRAGLPCPRCKHPVRVIRQGQRSTFYCPHCQK
jgi:formamidopyrimidine-DNA glycosylase